MIVPFFLRNRGCAHRCHFCNQEISGGVDPRELGADYFHGKVRAFLASAAPGKKPRQRAEIAFYGGNFTGLAPKEQENLLRMAGRHLEDGAVAGIRVATRPDCLAEEDVERLAAFGVRTVEIGAQSLIDDVLAASGRGHAARDVVVAVARLQRRGLAVIIHLMAGLPGDDGGAFLESVSLTAALGPQGVRIHPTLVLAGSPLAEDFLQGRYAPLTLPAAVDLCRQAWDILAKAGVPIIRLGLQATDILSGPGAVLGGPYHPAFGALVASARWRERTLALLAGADLRGRTAVFLVPPREESAFRGPGNCNIEFLRRRCRLAAVEIKRADGDFHFFCH
ncbi:MAG: radical SAM protein [Pseudomonadota bacterium]|nr:radical SAM protein [Pseudomonadota bacterium]